MKKHIGNILLVVVAFLLAANLFKPTVTPPASQFVAASFERNGNEIVMTAGERLTVRCDSGFRLENGSNFRNLNLLCKDAPAPSKTLTPTNTVIVETPAPTETLIPADTPTSEYQAWEVWHPVGAHELPDGSMSGVHEHGQKPPQWVDEWSMENFGHPLIYGGDEASGEMEIMHKHEAYGGFNFSFSPNGCKVDGYLRYHASSTPADRAASVHSFEIYVRDCAGNISINQGVYWTGDPNNLAQRMCRAHELAGVVLPDGRVTPGRDQYIIAGRCESDTAKSEQWYTHFVNWDFSLTLLDATTYFHYGESDEDPTNRDTWELTGSNELTLRVEITSLPNPRVSLPREYRYPLDAWWCAQHLPTIGTRRYNGQTLTFPYWQITGEADSPSDCPAGFLPQYNASTMPALYADMPGGNTIPRIRFDGAGEVEVPN